jgi:DNA-binding CsgD family transcriptional regulator
MIRNDEHFLALTDAIHAAGLGTAGWTPALEAIAGATGSRSGQLIGVGSDASVPFNLTTDAEPDFAEAFARAGGGDPAINPRVYAGGSAPVLRVLSESDYLTQSEYRRHPFIQEIVSLWGYAFTCLTTLERRNDMLIGLAVLRTEGQGHISLAEREAFSTLAPHVRSAVRTQLALEGQGADLLAGAMEKLSIAAFVCDARGYVRRLTPAAERLVRDGTILRLRSNRLRGVRACDTQALEFAMSLSGAPATAAGQGPGLRSVVMRDEREVEGPLVLDVIDLPPVESELGFAARTLVIARGQSHGIVSRAAVVRAAFNLSVAETEVALQLCKGLNPEAIAQGRRVSVDTVRAQIKKTCAKLGVKSQLELVARINRAMG